MLIGLCAESCPLLKARRILTVSTLMELTPVWLSANKYLFIIFFLLESAVTNIHVQENHENCIPIFIERDYKASLYPWMM